MRVGPRLRALFARVARSSWETRVAIGAPLFIALLAVPVLLGAFASAAPGGNSGGYGGPATTVTIPVTISIPVTTRPHPCPPAAPICR